MGVRGTNPSAITWGEIEKRDGGLGLPGEQLEVVSGEMAPQACSLSGAQPQLTASKSVLVLPASSKTKPQQQVPQPALTQLGHSPLLRDSQDMLCPPGSSLNSVFGATESCYP